MLKMRKIPGFIPFLFVFIALLFVPSTGASGAGNDEKTDITQRTRELMRVTEDLRGLDFISDLPVELVTTERMAEIVEEMLDEEIKPEIDRSYSALYTMLGLMPRGSSLRADYESLVEEQVAGLYDPQDKRFYVVDIDLGSVLEGMFGDLGAIGSFLEGFMGGLGFDMSDVIIVHELTHALDDQHFDIESKMEELLDSNSDDAQLAYQSLVEGNATRIMNEYTYEQLGVDQSMLEELSDMNIGVAEDMMSYSPFIERLMIVPYFKGEAFVNYLNDREGQAGIDQAFRDPPTSMEQILHPERYFPNRDEPSWISPVDLSDVLSGWDLEATDTLGELIIGLMFEMYVTDRAGGEEIADGWDYDVVTSWRSPNDDLALAWASVWDDSVDSREFFDAYCDLLEAKYPPGEWSEKTSDYALYTGMGLAAAVERLDDMVVVIEGVPESEMDACMAEAWTAGVVYN
jgi:hypothetical protein